MLLIASEHILLKKKNCVVTKSVIHNVRRLPVNVTWTQARNNTPGIKYTEFTEFFPLRDPTRPKAHLDRCRGAEELNIVYCIPYVLFIAIIPHLHSETCICFQDHQNTGLNLSIVIAYFLTRWIYFNLFIGYVFNWFSIKCGIKVITTHMMLNNLNTDALNTVNYIQ